MPAHVVVFCKRSVAHLTPEMLSAELECAELEMLAETLELPEGEEAAVDEMWTRYRIDARGREAPSAESSGEGGRGAGRGEGPPPSPRENGAPGPSFDGAEIHWHATQRPIQIERRPPLAGEIEETLEDLADADGDGPARVREHLRETTEIVAFEMGIDGSRHLAAAITEVLAFFVAEEGDGIAWFYHRDFASPDNRGETLWTTAE